jgi:hypothetical protein
MTMTAGPLVAHEDAHVGRGGHLTEVAPPVTEPAPVATGWASLARRLARSASQAATVVPGVASATFGITGSPAEPALELECTLREGQDTPFVIERLTHTVVEDLEELLGTEFAERHISVRVERGGASVAPALATAS